MTRVLFLIRSLGRGGAERQLLELIKGLNKSRFAITLVVFYDGGALRPAFELIRGIEIVSLHKAHRWDLIPFLSQLWKTVRRVRPHIVHGYMGVANELALLVGKVFGAKVVWGLRSSIVDFSNYDWAHLFSFRISALLSHFPDLIIVNSHAGRRHHISHSYDAAKIIVIPNGIDTNLFKPDHDSGSRWRASVGISATTRLIGIVARFDPIKDHETFLRAAALLVRETPNLHFACVGAPIEPFFSRARHLACSLNLHHAVTWCPPQDSMPHVYNALDILVSSSLSEGFSNVLAEAMACGVLCVATNVGDSALILADAGFLVPPRDPQSLFKALASALACSQKPSLREKSRQRVIHSFSSERMIASTSHILSHLS